MSDLASMYKRRPTDNNGKKTSAIRNDSGRYLTSDSDMVYVLNNKFAENYTVEVELIHRRRRRTA